MTQKHFLQVCESAGFGAKLAAGVIRQLGGWYSAKQTLNDVRNALDGYSGFTYYEDTCGFAWKYREEILSYCDEMDQQLEGVGVPSFIASFNCLDKKLLPNVCRVIYAYTRKQAERDEESTTILNALAWFALEECARIYQDEVFNLKD